MKTIAVKQIPALALLSVDELRYVLAVSRGATQYAPSAAVDVAKVLVQS